MAKRPRSHQLEDESITAFRAARPSGWPVRKKDDDYGIDLEVEIFDEEETSTGLLFFVQLKATDAATERKISLDREYLQDICQYDSPTIIVRYFARDGRLYWAWAADLLAQFPEGQAEGSALVHLAGHFYRPAQIIHIIFYQVKSNPFAFGVIGEDLVQAEELILVFLGVESYSII